jgi:hypothetical protein
MPEKEIAERGGAVRWRTVRVGKGKNRKYLKVAIVRKKGVRGGTTVAGPVHTPKGS